MIQIKFNGMDSNDNYYESVDEIYNKVNREEWYKLDKSVWDNMESNEKGMVDGHTQIIPIDESNSHRFLREILIKYNYNIETCLDLGGGVGRVTKNVLSKYYKKIDICDQCEVHINKAKELKNQFDFIILYTFYDTI